MTTDAPARPASQTRPRPSRAGIDHKREDLAGTLEQFRDWCLERRKIFVVELRRLVRREMGLPEVGVRPPGQGRRQGSRGTIPGSAGALRQRRSASKGVIVRLWDGAKFETLADAGGAAGCSESHMCKLVRNGTPFAGSVWRRIPKEETNP